MSIGEQRGIYRASFVIVAFSILLYLGGIDFSTGDNNVEDSVHDGPPMKQACASDEKSSVAAVNRNHSYLAIMKQLPWSDALHWCLAHNGKLAHVKSIDDMRLLISIVRSVGSDQEKFWLGGSNHGVNGSFVWLSTDRSQVDRRLFSKVGDQTTTNCTANCISLKVKKKEEGLATYYCVNVASGPCANLKTSNPTANYSSF